MNSVIIAPSILSADFCNLEAELGRVATAEWVHVDVMDGHFVPNITIGIPVVKSLREKTERFLDVHLMIDKPARYISAFAKAGADGLTVQLESDHPTGIQAALDEMKALGIKRGIALRPITDADAVLPYIHQVELILVMTVEPGFGGQAFMPDKLETIRRVRAHIEANNPNCRLQVDGGIDESTAALVKKAGADTLVAGSAIYGADDPAAAIEAIRRA